MIPSAPMRARNRIQSPPDPVDRHCRARRPPTPQQSQVQHSSGRPRGSSPEQTDAFGDGRLFKGASAKIRRASDPRLKPRTLLPQIGLLTKLCGQSRSLDERSQYLWPLWRLAKISASGALPVVRLSAFSRAIASATSVDGVFPSAVARRFSCPTEYSRERVDVSFRLKVPPIWPWPSDARCSKASVIVLTVKAIGWSRVLRQWRHAGSRNHRLTLARASSPRA